MLVSMCGQVGHLGSLSGFLGSVYNKLPGKSDWFSFISCFLSCVFFLHSKSQILTFAVPAPALAIASVAFIL